jgi:hypothetical protein
MLSGNGGQGQGRGAGGENGKRRARGDGHPRWPGLERRNAWDRIGWIAAAVRCAGRMTGALTGQEGNADNPVSLVVCKD